MSVLEREPATLSREAGARPLVAPRVWPTELGWLLSAAVIAVFAASIPAFHNALFYFRDDFQIQFLPMFGEIARLLKSGEFPLMTDRIWFGGAIIGEYQFGTFNPVTLALYLVIDELERAHHAATLFVLVHIALLAGGLYALSREFGADRPSSLLAAVVGSTSSWLIYWAAATWVPALVGTTWVPWGVWSLLRVYRDRRWLIPAALLSFMVLVSGWPYAKVALGVSVTVAISILYAKDRRLSACLRVVLAFGAALLLSAPALLPVLAYLDVSDRMAGSFWHPSLGDVLLASGVPLFPTVLQVWTGDYRIVISPSTYYLSWFVPLVLANALARRTSRCSTAQVILWSAAAAFALLCVVPAVWQFRFPFRFLPYFHIVLVLLVAVILTEGSRRSEGAWRLWPSAAAVLLPFYVAVGNAPDAWEIQLLLLALIALAVAMVVRLQHQRRAEWRGFLVASHILLFAVLSAIVPANRLVPAWDLPAQPATADPLPAAGLRTFTLYPPSEPEEAAGVYERSEILPEDYWISLAPANTTLYRRAQTINGYSALLQHGFAEIFCLEQKGGTCEDGPSRLAAVDPETNRSYLDLMAVDRVVALRGPYSEAFSAHAGSGWAIAGRTDLFDIFERTTPRARVGNIVQMPAGARAWNAAIGVRSESYDVAVNGAGGRVVVARAWYPGIVARLDGKEMPVESIAGIVPAVILPAGAQGRLTVEYWPVGLTQGLCAAAAGLCLLLGIAAFWRFAEGRRAPGRERVRERSGA